MIEFTCSFFGHRKITVTDELKIRLTRIIKRLITENNVDTFLFGSRSQFDDLCHETVTQLKKQYPHIRRVYVRAEYPYINDDYKNYLLQSYESTYYPERITGAGKASYIERNCEMINKSGFCVIYYDESAVAGRKSGTKAALDYAALKKRTVYTLKP